MCQSLKGYTIEMYSSSNPHELVKVGAESLRLVITPHPIKEMSFVTSELCPIILVTLY